MLVEVVCNVLGEVEGNIEDNHEYCTLRLLLGMADRNEFGDALKVALENALDKVKGDVLEEVEGHALGESVGDIEGYPEGAAL